MTRKEQIIEVLQKHIFADGDIWVIYDLKKMYDDLLPILALPLEVPSDEELDDEAFSRRYQKNNEFDAMYADAFIYGADWMKNEIIKRNTKK
jgi:hypothetical protein